MAGWPLFVYPKYFCSQNKPAERRSHPSNSTGTVTANGPSLPLTAGAPAGLWLNWVIGVRGDQPKNAILGYIWSNLNNLPNPESFVEWTIDDLRDDYDHRFDFATESPAIKPFPTLYGE
jgi:hypothetical protein